LCAFPCLGAGAVDAAVVNDHAGPLVLPAEFFATTFHEYVVPAARLDTLNVDDPIFDAIRVDPRYTSYDCAPESLQLNPTDVLTPVAPFAGLGDDGTPGTDVCSAAWVVPDATFEKADVPPLLYADTRK